MNIPSLQNRNHQAYGVMVSGVCLYKTDDILMASAVKSNYETIGWKNVTIAPVGDNIDLIA